MKTKLIWLGLLFSLLYVPSSFAATASVPQPATCMVGQFTKTGNEWWVSVDLKITNQCGKDVDVQNMSVTFNNAENLITNFWGNFGSVAYPDNNLQTTSQPDGAKGYLITMPLHFPEDNWANKTLAKNQSILLQYSVAKSTYDPNSIKVYLNGQAIEVGQIDLTNTTAQPAGISENPWVSVKSVSSQQVVSRIQVPWGGSKKSITNLAPGSYAILPESIANTNGDQYEGTATPNQVSVSANQTLASNLSYVKVVQKGKVKINVQTLPLLLSGYTQNPTVTLTRTDTGSTVNATAPWGQTTTVDELAPNKGFTFSTPIINFNGKKCTPTFTPISLMSSDTTPQTTNLTYACVVVNQVAVTLNVTGLSEANPTVNTVKVDLTPNDGTSVINKDIAVSGGTGEDTVRLTEGVIYNVHATSVNGYSVSYSPQPLTAQTQASEKITYTKSAAASGLFAAYFPTWYSPYFNTFCDQGAQYWDYSAKSWKPCTPGAVLPDDTIAAASLLAGGVPNYVTHVMISFAKFNQMHNYAGVSKNDGDLKNLGLDLNISSASFKEAIRVLKQKNPGTKVILALGGATFNDSWNNVTDADITKVAQLMNDLGIDGLDVDYEVGGTSPEIIDQYYNAIKSMRKAVDLAGNGKILTLAAWSTGADCTQQTQGSTYPDCAGKVSYWGGNAGRERLVLQGKGASSLLDVISIMSYDADYQHYDPVVAYNQYKQLAKPGTRVAIGVQPSPDEGWGGARTLVDDRGINNDCVGNTILQDQYNVPKPGTFSVQRLANAIKDHPEDGMMMWSLFAYRTPLMCGSVPVSTVTQLGQGVSQYLGIGTDRTTLIDYNTAINYGRR